GSRLQAATSRPPGSLQLTLKAASRQPVAPRPVPPFSFRPRQQKPLRQRQPPAFGVPTEQRHVLPPLLSTRPNRALRHQHRPLLSTRVRPRRLGRSGLIEERSRATIWQPDGYVSTHELRTFGRAKRAGRIVTPSRARAPALGVIERTTLFDADRPQDLLALFH